MRDASFYFPREDEGDWRRTYTRRVRDYQAAQLNAGRRDTDPSNDQCDAIAADIKRAHNYDLWRERKDVELGLEMQLWKGVEELKVSSLPDKDVRKLPAFKLEYDTLDEIKMRFQKTIIMIKGNPFYVKDQRKTKDGFYFLLEDVNTKLSLVPLKEIPDFRGPASGYVKGEYSGCWMYRVPARVNTQGLSHQNTVMRRIGKVENLPVNTRNIMVGLASRGSVLPWDTSYARLVSEGALADLRLSDDIAVYNYRNTIKAEYKGRQLGTVNDNVVTLKDEDDMSAPWIANALRKVNLEART